MAAEGIQDQLSLGAELPVTLAALLFRPGHLTREYLAGRIVRYAPPLRLYLVASLAFIGVRPDGGRAVESRQSSVFSLRLSVFRLSLTGPPLQRT
ncbi:MAG: DUF3667 domain-containing protein [Gemmatimonadetes bacterium]|nr:DUF3667 domain-containing protein [Gemmatimonadota bacterium]